MVDGASRADMAMAWVDEQAIARLGGKGRGNAVVRLGPGCVCTAGARRLSDREVGDE